MDKSQSRKPRLGFLGVGWIGRHRMEVIAQSEEAEISALCDPSSEMMDEALKVAPSAQVFSDFDLMLKADLDGVVIATPSALHATQAIQAIENGKAVFCQKPLGRTATEVNSVLQAARKANRLLSVDLSYRYTEAIQKIRHLILEKAIGEVYGVDLVFHNAYGPDKPWFYNPQLSGGGCVMDLGVHLVDLALWMMNFPKIREVSSQLFSGGRRMLDLNGGVEDYALATLDLSHDATIRLACSWRLPAGCDAVIEAVFYGTQGALSFRNVNGSFYDFIAERFHGTRRELLVAPPDAWGGRAGVHWAKRLTVNPNYDSEVDSLLEVAHVLDSIYGR